MPALLNEAHEKFCQAYSQGYRPVECVKLSGIGYRRDGSKGKGRPRKDSITAEPDESGPIPASDLTTAWKLLALFDIQMRLKELAKERDDKAKRTQFHREAEIAAARVVEKGEKLAELAEASAPAEEDVLSKKWVLAKLVENVNRAMAAVPVNAHGGLYKYEGSTANRALELIGKELGMFIDRSEVVTSEFAELTHEERQSAIRALMHSLDEPKKVINANSSVAALAGPGDPASDVDRALAGAEK